MERNTVWIMALAEVSGVSAARGCSWGVERIGGGRYRRERVSPLGLTNDTTGFQQPIDGSGVD